MADGESITRAAGPFGSLTSGLVAKLGEQAFLVASHMALQENDPAEWPDAEVFSRDVAQVFEALLACRAEEAGHGFLSPDCSQWAMERLAEVPQGFRPTYEAGRLRRLHERSLRPSPARAAPVTPSCSAPPAVTPVQAEPARVQVPVSRCPLAAVTSTWLLGGRSEAEGGGEAPLQSGARID